MKKKTQQSSNQKRHAQTKDPPHPSSDWKRESSEKRKGCQTDLAVMTARSSQEKADEVFQERVPLIQITMSVFQIDQSFKFCGEQIVAGVQGNVSGNAPHLIGIGRNQRSQWTMVTAPIIGVAKKQGNIKMDF